MGQPDLGVRVGHPWSPTARRRSACNRYDALLPIPGSLYSGNLPGELQTVIVYGMSRSANAEQWDRGTARCRSCAPRPRSLPLLEKIGLDPDYRPRVG